MFDVIGCLSQTDFPTLSASGSVASACALLSAAALASSLAPASRVSSPAVFAVGSHARFTPMHDARNSLLTRRLIRLGTSGAEKCVGAARWGTGLSCRP